jgi:2-dehydropantoate 2-reductase
MQKYQTNRAGNPMNDKKRILFFGAGVIGSIYALKLIRAGHDVTVLARGKRLQELSAQGIILENIDTGKKEQCPVRLIAQLDPEDVYDWIIVTVKKNQVRDILPVLEKNKSKAIIFMVNNPSGFDEWAEAVGGKRLLAGFCASGGFLADGSVKYLTMRSIENLLQSTTFGEISGTITPRLRNIVTVFRQAGFRTVHCNNMDAWLKTHIAMVSPIANAIYACGNSNYELAKSAGTVRKMVVAIREGLVVVRALGYPVTPIKLNALRLMPVPVLTVIFRWILNTEFADTYIAKHANAARDEMKQLADEFLVLRNRTGIQTPAIEEFYKSI